MSDPYADALGLADPPPAAPSTPSSTPAPLRANNPGALMPGGKLATYSSPQDGLSAMDANLQAYGKQGVNTLAGVISKWAPPSQNNTPAYIADVSKRLGLDPTQPIDLTNPVVRHAIGTGILLHENGAAGVFGGKSAAPAPAAAAPTSAAPAAAADPYAAALGLGAAPATAPTKPASPAPTPSASPNENWWDSYSRQANATQAARDAGKMPPANPLQVGASLASSGVGAVAGGLTGIFTGLKSLASGEGFDTAMSKGADSVKSTEKALTYTPSDPQSREVVDAVNSKANPLNWPGVAGDYVGGKLADAGYPGAGAAVATVGAALPMLAATKPGRAAVTSAASSLADLARPPVPLPPRVEPAMEGAPVVPGATPAPAAGVVKATPPAAAPDITPTETIKAGQTLPKSEQAARAQVLQDAGFTTSRDSAISGDNRARAVEYQMSKFQEPAGDAAAQQFASEAQTLGDYTRGLIDKAGGTTGLDQGSLYGRGQAIVRPIQALRDWFDDKASGLYQAADQKAQGQPVTLNGFRDTLNDASQLTNPDRVALQGAANAFAQKAGMTLGDDGSLNGTALQAETVRKWLNKQRTNSNGGFVDDLKSSMDDDVGQSAGGPIYDQARALWRLRQQTLGDPKGISSLLDEEGTNRTVPFERVPSNVMKLPQDQFAHIVQTLQNMPPELQGVANGALGEIKAQFYNQMLDGATSTRGGNARPFWNGTNVRNVINDNSGKLQTLLSPDELKSVDTLRKAGDILGFDPSYPGAAAQAQNAVKHGLMSNVVGHAATVAGAGAGSLVGFPGTGAVLGRMVGEKAKSAVGQKGALGQWQKGAVNLRDIAGGAP